MRWTGCLGDNARVRLQSSVCLWRTSEQFVAIASIPHVLSSSAETQAPVVLLFGGW